MKIKTFIISFIAFSLISTTLSAQKKTKAKKQLEQIKTFGNRVSVRMPNDVKFLTYGYLLDSLKKIDIPFNYVLYGKNKIYYETNGIYVSLDAGALSTKTSMDKVIQDADFFLLPNEAKDYEILNIKDNRVLLKYFRDNKMIRLTSVDSSGFARIQADIYNAKGNYEGAKKEAKRLANNFDFLSYKPSIPQKIQIKDLVKFDIPETANQIDYNQFIKFLKDSNHYFSVIPNLDRKVYYQYNNLTVCVVSTPRPKPISFDEWVKTTTAPVERFDADSETKVNYQQDHSIHSFAGKRVLVRSLVDPNNLSINGLSDSGDVSYSMYIYFKAETKLAALQEMERFVRSIEFVSK